MFVGTDPITGTKRKKSVTAPTKKEAELLAAGLALKASDLNLAKQSKSLTVGEAIDRYIEQKRAVLSPTTIQGYEKIRRNSFPSLMKMSINKVTNPMLQSAVAYECNRKTRRGGYPSPKTIKEAFSLVATVIKKSRPNWSINVDLPSPIRHIKHLPEPEAVLNAIKGSSVELPVLLAAWLSLSMSEIRGIKWSSIYDRNGEKFVVIENSVVDVYGEAVEKSHTKTYTRTRALRLPEYLCALIDKTERTSEYLINMNRQTIYKRFVRILEQNSLPRMTFHDLRHLNASVMAMLAIPDKYAQERGGWATDRIMKSVYQHTFAEARRQADTKIDDYFSSIMK